MRKKKLFMKLAAYGLCITMLAGCSNEPRMAGDTGDPGNGTIVAMTDQIRAKYADSAALDYAEPMYNLEKDHVFVYQDLDDAFMKKEPYDCFAVYYDSDLQNKVDVSFEQDYDTNSLTIAPNLVFSYEDKQGSMVDDGTWGTRSKFFLVQYMDTKTGNELEKPLVTVFTIAQDLNTPTLAQKVGDDGNYTLEWSKVDGADYYEVYAFDAGMEFASLEVTTEETSCQYDDFETAKSHKARFEERYSGTEIDTESRYTMNELLFSDSEDFRYFVVAKKEDGTHSGMSNECIVKDVANQIPYMVSDEFQDEYHGDSVLALPAYADVQMLDGSVGQFLIEYKGAKVVLMEGGRIRVFCSLKNLPIEMQPVDLIGMDFDTFMEQTEQLKQRAEELATKSGTVKEDVNIPYVPETDQTEAPSESGDGGEETSIVGGGDEEIPGEETPLGGDDEATPSKETPLGGDDEATPSEETPADGGKSAGLDVSVKLSETVFASTALSEWIALNLLSHNEEISLRDFQEASDTDYLKEAFQEAYRQNPLCGIVSKLDYDYSSNTLLIQYVLSKEDTKDMQEKSLDKAAEIVGEIIKTDMSPYEKEEAINQYICENASYNDEIMDYIESDGSISEQATLDFANSFTPYGVLLEKKGVCESYAEAFQLIAKTAGLEAVIETGRLDGVNHEWNRVNIDGMWYVLDVTNNDSEFLPNCYFNLPDEVAANYLMEDGKAFMSQSADSFSASDMDNEYYTKHNLYTEDSADASAMLGEQLLEKEVAAVRMDGNYGDGNLERIVGEALSKANLETCKYYYHAGVVSIVK